MKLNLPQTFNYTEISLNKQITLAFSIKLMYSKLDISIRFIFKKFNIHTPLLVTFHIHNYPLYSDSCQEPFHIFGYHEH